MIIALWVAIALLLLDIMVTGVNCAKRFYHIDARLINDGNELVSLRNQLKLLNQGLDTHIEYSRERWEDLYKENIEERLKALEATPHNTMKDAMDLLVDACLNLEKEQK